jgi:hypothetical protein
MLIEADGFIRSVDHRLGRSNQGPESGQRQPSEACRIIVKAGVVSFGDGSGDLLDHAGGR